MNDLPDLPQLEEIETGYYRFSPCRAVYTNHLIITALLQVTATLNVVQSRLHICVPPHKPYLFFVPLGITIAALLILLIDICFLQIYKWRTDERGLTVKKLLWQNFTAWADVHAVEVKISSATKLPEGYRLLTHDRKMWVPASRPYDRSRSLLIGSMWQHLRRLGKADQIVISERLEDLWWQIPETTPREVTWKNAMPPSWKTLRCLLIVKAAGYIALMALTVVFLGWHTARTVIWLTVVIIGGFWSLLWSYLKSERAVATEVRMDCNKIEATTGFGQMSLGWQEVQAAHWDGSVLKIGGPRAVIRIPIQSNSRQLLLAVLRNLRAQQRFDCIAVPKELRQCPTVRN